MKRDARYYAHIKVEYSVPDQPILAVRGIDLGLKRSVATVALTSKPQKRSFRMVRDGVKRARLRTLRRRIAELQQAQKWEPLKRIRHKRLHVAEYYDRLMAKHVADVSNGMLVGVG